MNGFLDILLSNALGAVPLAIAAFIIGRLVRRPAVSHVLWLLVLLRLVAPPVWEIEFDRPLPAVTTPELSLAITAEEARALGLAEDDHETVMDIAPALSALTPIDAATGATATPSFWSTIPWMPILFGIWAAGALWFLARGAYRTGRLGRAVRRAPEAPRDIQKLVESVAGRLGLRRAPRVAIVPAALPPLVLGLPGGPRLVLPADALERLDRAELRTVVAHECAHILRRDHLCRWIELAACVAFWWHPVAWWARRELRAHEERCCDAWVLWAYPEHRRAYASGFLRCVEMLAVTQRQPAPAAVGMGALGPIKRRVDMILTQDRVRPMITTRWLIVVFAACLVALPAFAQESPESAHERAAVKQSQERHRLRKELHEAAKKTHDQHLADVLRRAARALAPRSAPEGDLWITYVDPAEGTWVQADGTAATPKAASGSWVDRTKAPKAGAGGWLRVEGAAPRARYEHRADDSAEAPPAGSRYRLRARDAAGETVPEGSVRSYYFVPGAATDGTAPKLDPEVVFGWSTTPPDGTAPKALHRWMTRPSKAAPKAAHPEAVERFTWEIPTPEMGVRTRFHRAAPNEPSDPPERSLETTLKDLQRQLKALQEQLDALRGGHETGEIKAPRGATIRGMVVDPDGRPIEGANVIVVSGDRKRTTVTDAEGRLVIEGLAPGRAVLEVGAEKRGDGRVELELDGQSRIEIILSPDKTKTLEKRGVRKTREL